MVLFKATTKHFSSFILAFEKMKHDLANGCHNNHEIKAIIF